MPTTARDLVEASFREIRVLGRGSTLSAEDAAIGLAELARAVNDLDAERIDLVGVSAPDELSDTMGALAEFESLLILRLAQTLAPQYNKDLSPMQMMRLQRAEATALASSWDDATIDIDGALVDRPGRGDYAEDLF
jgi:hypothetical protein